MSPESSARGKKRLERWLRFPKSLFARVLNGGRTVVARCANYRQRSLVNRLSLFLIVGTVVLYVIGVGAIYMTASRLIESSLRKQAAQWVAELEESGTPLYFSRESNPPQIERKISHIPEISLVRYYDSTGKRVLGQFGDVDKHAGQPISEARLEALLQLVKTEVPYLFESGLDGDDDIHVVAPVRVRSIRSDGMFSFNVDAPVEDVKIIGYFDLAIDPSSYRAQMQRTIAYGSLITAVVLLIVMFAGRRLIRKALRPLIELQTPLARLARGEIDVSVAPGGDREIAAISHALNVTISALKQRNETLHQLADRDSLTGLHNRNYFSRALDAALERVKGGAMTSALLFIDLDRFKFINDSFGHRAGDRLLVEVAGLIKTRMRNHDVLARFGGDEFTVVAQDVSKEAAQEIAKGILEILLDYRFVEDGQSFSISCSVGVAMISAQSSNAEEVLTQADAACYEAKSVGRNCYVVFEPNHQQTRAQESDVSWSQTIRDAIRGNGFALVYQPIVSVKGAEQEIYEVLLRLPGTGGRILMPDRFLPAAEGLGLLAEIDNWVITHALEALAEMRRQGRDVVFSINLSGQVFSDPGVVERIRHCLSLNGVPPRSVVFEITEQTAVRHVEKTRQLTQELIDMGCRFALDDFGAGFSSFSYLKRLPVEWIKIDGSFIRNLDREPIDRILVKSMIDIAKALGKEVVAEFVQNEATVELLKGYGVDYLQGRHFGTPSETLPPPTVATGRATAHQAGLASLKIARKRVR